MHEKYKYYKIAREHPLFSYIKISIFSLQSSEHAENWSEAGRSTTYVMKRPKFNLDRKEEYEIRY